MLTLKEYIEIIDRHYTLRLLQGEDIEGLVGYCASKSGDELMQEICTVLGAERPVFYRGAQSQLEDQINAFDGNKSIVNILALYQGFTDLSGKSFGHNTMPTFTIEISSELQQAKSEAEELAAQQAEAARREVAERQAREEQIRQAQEEQERLERQNLQQHLNYLQGDNKNALANYIDAFNYCIENHMTSAELFKDVYNNQSWRDADQNQNHHEQITDEEATSLYDAFYALNNGQRIERYAPNNQKYTTIKQNEVFLNAEGKDERIAAIVYACVALNQPQIDDDSFVGDNNLQPEVVEFSIDNLCGLFNNKNSEEDFKQEVKNLMRAEIDQEEKDDAANKLCSVLTYFANQNDDGKISQEQQDMLKNNQSFIEWLFGLIVSKLPEFCQFSWSKRYEFESTINASVIWRDA